MKQHLPLKTGYFVIESKYYENILFEGLEDISKNFDDFKKQFERKIAPPQNFSP